MNSSSHTIPAEESGHVRVLPINEVFPSPENVEIYGHIDPTDPEVQLLADLIRKDGIHTPLLITTDYFIISGHRRHMAATMLGLREIPCLMSGISREHDHDEFIRRLVQCNAQRVKTTQQKIRESVILVNPDDAYQALLEHREQEWQVALADCIDLGPARARHEISPAKRPMLNAAKAYMADNRAYLPMSDRQIHYGMLNDPPLRHARKRGSRYRNDDKSYKDLTDLLARARVAGDIPMDAIHDPTRPVTIWRVSNDVGPYIRGQLNSFLGDYRRNLQQSQPAHVEIVGEKNTIDAVLRRAAGPYGIPVTTGRGFCSLPPRAKMAQRFAKSGKSKLIVLIVSDFDPEGESIAVSFPRSMRDDFGISNLAAVKVALTAGQVQEFDLPPGAKAKNGSRRKKFVEQYGENVFELEALKPQKLEQIVRDAIESVMDRDRLNEELDREKADSVDLEALRRRVRTAVGDLDGGQGQ